MMARFLQAALVTALTASTPAFAQSSSVVNLILPAVDAQTIVGSVINAGPTATTYAVSCPSGTDDADCGLGPGLSVVQGPSTLEIHETFQSATVDVSCVIPNSNTMTCTEVALGGPDPTSTVDVITDISDFLLPVTLTAGLAALSTASAAPNVLTTAAAGATGSSAASAATGITAGGLNPNATALTASGQGSSMRTSTAGVPRATQNAVLIGVVALMGGALAL